MDDLTALNIVGTSPLRRGRRHRLLRLFLCALVSGVLLSVALPLGPVRAVSGVYYLKGDGVPSASLSTSAPTKGSLPDYNGRGPGLLLEISNVGLGETDPDKYQMWATSAGSIDLDGAASLTFWSATADLEGGQRGVVLAGLYDCDSALSGCNLIRQAQLDITDWSGGSTTWVEHVIDFGSVTHSIATGRTLTLKLVVGNNAYDDMVFAYDTTSDPSRLSLQLASSSTTTTSTSTTTSTTTTTTSVPGSTTTTSTSTTVPRSTTTTSTTTTTLPGSTTSPPEPGPPAAPPDAEPGAQVGDPSLNPLATPQDASVSPLTGGGLAVSVISGLELVIPPWVAAGVASPLLILEFLLQAMTGSAEAVLMPALFLTLGMIWLVIENRLRAFAVTRRRDERGEEA